MTAGDDPRADQADTDAGSEAVGGATEPITLTDPDGAVTRVAPWSTWTREQVRAPGGEPALVTRLDQGQLWFAAGRRRSPWRHEVQVGPAVVSTPRGRFHVTAEPDGGATIACLSGRTRIVTGLREPVVLGPDQTAAVASDGATLVVMDRANNADYAFPVDDDWPTGLDDEQEAPLLGVGAVAGAVAAASLDVPSAAEPEPVPVAVGAGVGAGAGTPGEPAALAPAPGGRRRRRRLPWLPEVVAVLAILGVAIAGFVVFAGGSSDDDADVAGPTTATSNPPGSSAPPATATTEAAATSAAPSTTATPTTVPRTTVPPTTRPPTTAPITTAPPRTAPPTTATPTPPPTITGPPGVAVGRLASCRRVAGAVVASVDVTHRSGGADAFLVDVALVDGAGRAFAEAAGTSPVIAQGSSAMVDVTVSTDGPVRGACELRGVSSR